MTGLSLRLLDLRRIKQRGDDRRRADADRDPGLDQLGAPLIVGVVVSLSAIVNPCRWVLRAILWSRFALGKRAADGAAQPPLARA
jgi:hypothetical protein